MDDWSTTGWYPNLVGKRERQRGYRYAQYVQRASKKKILKRVEGLEAPHRAATVLWWK
jgi:hypothetical protein